MRHQKFGKKLNRDIKERKSLFKNLVSSLILQGKITTTVAKAKAIRGLIDKLVNKSKEGTLATQRQIAGFLNRSDVVKKLINVIAPKFKKRQSGFTRIVRTDQRTGDGAPQAIMEWVEEIDKNTESKPAGVKDITKEDANKDKADKKTPSNLKSKNKL